MTSTADRNRLRQQVFEVVLDKVRQDRYPSTQQLDLLERHLDDDERRALAEVLVEKIRQDRYPSLAMIRRVIRLAA